MLLDPEHVISQSPQAFWLETLDPALTHEREQKPRRIVKKLRRMQSQNFVQRVVFNVVKLVHRQDRETA